MLSINRENGNFTDQVNSNVTVSPYPFDRSDYRPMDSLKKIVARIEKRLKAVGLKAATASKLAGLSESAIYNLKRGAAGKISTKGANASTFAALAPVLKSTVEWLTTGKGPETPEDDHIESSAVLQDAARKGKFVRVVGYVGAGSVAHYYAVMQDDFEEVEAPSDATDQTVAVEIRGGSLGNAFNSWLVYYDDIRSPITEELYNELCVVGLADDRILVKIVRPQRNGFFTLESNANIEPPIVDADVEWAALVTDMKKRK